MSLSNIFRFADPSVRGRFMPPLLACAWKAGNRVTMAPPP
eukprot:CAMPEP_0180806310 /NCGR_PEP_ID=MMETSP1038_2-20121128/62523_1 /TAXON_ID=632150 /ORGANISM="Azadinium spinosum, Strain 3D9" /LENGTH=39 /DNA_ID= /DNA_START= /DNA_END= /DNA_ORIENTATION=